MHRDPVGGPTSQLHVTRDIDAPPARVWAVVTDIDATPRTLSAVDHVERLDDGDGFAVGTRWRETRTMFGRQATEELVVTAVDPSRSYEVTAEHGRTTYRSVLTLGPIGAARTRLGMTFAARTDGLPGRVLAATVGRAFAGATRRSLQRDLDDIAEAAEAARGDAGT